MIRPEAGSRPVTFSTKGAMRSSVRVTVAEMVQLASGMSSQNFSGRPKALSRSAMVFQRLQAPPRSVITGAGVWLSP